MDCEMLLALEQTLGYYCKLAGSAYVCGSR